MKESEQINTLLNNIKKGVRKLGVNRFNAELELLCSDENDSKLNIIMLEVSRNYGMTISELMHSNNRGRLQEARAIAINLIKKHLDYSVRKIAKKVFKRDYHLFVSKAISKHNSLGDKAPVDLQYKREYEKIENIIKQKYN